AVVPVHGLPAGELVQNPHAGLAAAVARPAVAAEGEVRLRAGGGVVDADHPRADAGAEAEGRLRIVGVDGGGQAVAGQVGQFDRLLQRVVGGDADDGAEGLLHEQPVARAHAVHDHRVVVQAALAGEVPARV